jgi:hypothetical protein
MGYQAVTVIDSGNVVRAGYVDELVLLDTVLLTTTERQVLENARRAVKQNE